MPRSSVSVGWEVRAESIDQCADHIARLVSALADLDPVLSGWRDGGNSKRQAIGRRVVDPRDHADLVQRLLDGRIRGDFEKTVIESLGHTLHWWNGADDNRTAANLHIHIGSASLENSVVIDLPNPEAVQRLYSFDTARGLVKSLIGLCDPESTVWTSAPLRDRQRGPDRPTEDGRGIISGSVTGPAAGWANYFSDAHAATFDTALLPDSAIVETLEGGTLVMVGYDPADPPVADVLQVRLAMGYEAHG